MNEKEFAENVTRTLNLGLTRIDDGKLAKLRASRQKAMDAYREPVSILGMATVSGHVMDISTWIRKPVVWLPVLAIAAAIATYSLTATDDGYDDVGELDAKLLAGELPIDAFLDKDFGAWVKESAQ